MKRTHIVLLGLGLALGGGILFHRPLLNAVVGLFVGTSHNPGHARLPAVRIGAYALAATLTQEPELVWADPLKGTSKVDTRLDKAQVLKTQILEAQQGDTSKALAVLLERRQEPDAAQSLFQALAELASGKPAGNAEGAVPAAPSEGRAAPAYVASKGQSGIALVARVAQSLATKLAKPDMAPFDQVLFEHAIKLMGFHGAPPTGAPPVTKANPSPSAGQSAPAQPPPMDPEVRKVLRSLLADRATQVYAVRALGQLGDLETAQEIIEKPWKYPDASISDFGPNALQRYKEARKAAIAQGKGGGEAAFWQSMRIPPQHQDTAIELAMAGDGGARMAVERNFAVMDMAEKDLDSVRARDIDMVLRFPGSRAAWIGQRRIDGFFMSQDRGPKSYAIMLKAVEHDLQIVFSGKTWTWDDTKVLAHHQGVFNGLWHYVHAGNRGSKGDIVFEMELQALFRRHYQPVTFPKERDSTATDIAFELAVYAAHLKLPPLQFKGKGFWLGEMARKKLSDERMPEQLLENTFKGLTERSDQIWGMYAHLCIRSGEIRESDL